MPTRAFILIETQAGQPDKPAPYGRDERPIGRANQVVQALRSLPGVKTADVVTGSFDIIVLIEVDTMSAMAELVTGQMQGIRGVLRTITCVAAG